MSSLDPCSSNEYGFCTVTALSEIHSPIVSVIGVQNQMVKKMIPKIIPAQGAGFDLERKGCMEIELV